MTSNGFTKELLELGILVDGFSFSHMIFGQLVQQHKSQQVVSRRRREAAQSSRLSFARGGLRLRHASRKAVASDGKGDATSSWLVEALHVGHADKEAQRRRCRTRGRCESQSSCQVCRRAGADGREAGADPSDPRRLKQECRAGSP
jgi:hypothetical protein